MKLRSLLPAALLLAITTVSWTLAAAPAAPTALDAAAEALQRINVLDTLRRTPFPKTTVWASMAPAHLPADANSVAFREFFSNIPAAPAATSPLATAPGWIKRISDYFGFYQPGAVPAVNVTLPQPKEFNFICRNTDWFCPAEKTSFLGLTAQAARNHVLATPSTQAAHATNQAIATALEQVNTRVPMQKVYYKYNPAPGVCTTTDLTEIKDALTHNPLACKQHWANQQSLRVDYLRRAFDNAPTLSSNNNDQILRVYRTGDAAFGASGDFDTTGKFLQARPEELTLPQPKLTPWSPAGLGLFLARPETHTWSEKACVGALLVGCGLITAHTITPYVTRAIRSLYRMCHRGAVARPASVELAIERAANAVRLAAAQGINGGANAGVAPVAGAAAGVNAVAQGNNMGFQGPEDAKNAVEAQADNIIAAHDIARDEADKNVASWNNWLANIGGITVPAALWAIYYVPNAIRFATPLLHFS